MKKVLIATEKPFAASAIKKIQSISKKANYQLVLCEKYADKNTLLEAVADVDAMIVRSDKIDEEVLYAAKKLKIVVRAGAGYDNINCQVASENGVVVMNTPGQNSNAVAELVFGMMIMSARNGYNGKAGTELRGKKLGIHAFGNVGSYVAGIAHGFGMEVYAYDPYVSSDVMRSKGVSPVNSIEELYKTCQYISIHVPATEETNKIINYDLLNSMPKDAVVVNTARKEVICEESLLKIFKEREDFKFLSDIAPDCKTKIEENFEGRFFFTPKKMGAQTSEANINAGLAAAEQIVHFFEKGIIANKVN